MKLNNQKRANNTNRMIKSSHEGLIKAKKEYSIRIRSDMIFTNDNSLRLIEQFNYRKEQDCLKKRIIVLPRHHPLRSNTLFAVSDWVFAGLTKDLITYNDITLKNRTSLSKTILMGLHIGRIILSQNNI